MGIANAGIISGDYTLENGQNVALQGLEWLSLDYTAGLSRTDIEDGFTDRYGNSWQVGEWQYATRAQTETLLGSLWNGTYAGFSAEDAIGANWFITQFGGLSYDTGYGVDRIDGKRNNSRSTNEDSSQFFFGEDGDCVINDDDYEEFDDIPSVSESSCIGHLKFGENYWNSVTAFNVDSGEYELSYDNSIDAAYGSFHEDAGVNMGLYSDNNSTIKNYENSAYGSLLVRNSAVAVSEPISLVIFSLALLALVRTKRQRR